MKKEVQCLQCLTLLERKPATISRKTINSLGNKTGYKKRSKRKKKRARKKKSKQIPNKPNFGVHVFVWEKNKMVFNYIQFAENYVHGVGNLFLSHANWPRNGSTTIWSKIRFFFSIKLHWLMAKDYSLAVSKLSQGKKYLFKSFLYQDPQHVIIVWEQKIILHQLKHTNPQFYLHDVAARWRALANTIS